jgi:SagB-type dehydrogenase family enzyme
MQQPLPNVTFAKAKRIPLPYFEDDIKLNLSYDDLMNAKLNTSTSAPLSLKRISCFLHHACGVTSLKICHLLEGGELYTARSNPSSGGLHPSEVYLLLPPGLVEGEEGALVAHYCHLEHALQIRASISKSVWQEMNLGNNNFVVCCASLHWREVWKYGLRGFRYSLLDSGHLMAAMAVSAKVLSWNAIVCFLHIRFQLALVFLS